MGNAISVQPGQTFGRLTIVREGDRRITPSTPTGRRMFWCQCDCGAVRLMQLNNLTTGRSRSCGCLNSEYRRSPEHIARLAEYGRSPENIARLAEYGRSPENISRLAELNRSPENRARAAALNRTHGLSGHPLYGTWGQMIDRCENPKHKNFRDYGGRGIQVSPAWHDAAIFLAWIDANLGPRPDGATLDRIDNDAGYEPGNVKWSTGAEQARNRRARRKRAA